MHSRDERRRGFAWALAAALLVGLFAIPWKLAAGAGPTHTNTLVLLATAALLSTALSTWQRGTLPRPTRADGQIAAVLAVLTLLGNLGIGEAIRSLSPAVLTVTQRSEVVLSALLAWPLLGERVDGRFWIGAAIAAAGLWIQQPPGALASFAGSGLAFALAATVCFAAMAVWTRKYIHRIDPVAVNGLRLWLAVAFWFASYGLPPELASISGEQLLWAGLAALCGPFAGRLCMMIASRDLEIRFVSLCLLLSPLVALIAAWLLLDDLPTPRALTGGALMLCGITLPVATELRRPN